MGPQSRVQSEIRRKASSKESRQRARRPRSPPSPREEAGGEKCVCSLQISAQSNYQRGKEHGRAAHLLSPILLEMPLNH